jgi:hypothetical protein
MGWVAKRADVVRLLRSKRDCGGARIGDLRALGIAFPEAYVAELRCASYEITTLGEGADRRYRLELEPRHVAQRNLALQTMLEGLP